MNILLLMRTIRYLHANSLNPFGGTGREAVKVIPSTDWKVLIRGSEGEVPITPPLHAELEVRFSSSSFFTH